MYMVMEVEPDFKAQVILTVDSVQRKYSNKYFS